VTTFTTLGDLALDGTTVLVRADLNVPLDEGRVVDDFRIRSSLTTIAELRAAGAKVAMDGMKFVIRLDDGDPFDVVRDVLADTGAGIRRLGARRTTLEDIFMAEGEHA